MKFEDYVYEFYGPKQIYGEFFNHSLTYEEIRLAISLRKRDQSIEFCGDECDSIDREIVRDILLRLRGVCQVEHNVEPYFKGFFLKSK